jgi:lipopolysaccharide export system permease protein
MYILTRYVVWEVVKYFVVALLGLTLMFTFGMGVRKALSMGFPPDVMMQTMPYLLPEMLGITIPVALLLAVSSVFGRMTGSLEIVAIKSLGINPMAVVWPVLVLAAFLSLGTVWMYELSATWGKPGVLRIGCESLEKIAYSKLSKDRSFDCEQFRITVKKVDGRALILPTIILKGHPGQPEIILHAAEATLTTDGAAGVLWIACKQGELEVEGQGRMLFSDEQRHAVPMPRPVMPPYHRDYVAMGNVAGLVVELRTEIERMEAEAKQLDKLRQARQALDSPDAAKDAAAIAALNKRIGDYRTWMRRLRTEPYRRWSNGFACLCFALVGAPVAMLWRHADVLTNFFVCFLPILMVYYPLLMLSDDLTTSGALPPICFWLGNAVLAVPAILLLRRIIRH